MVPGSSSVLQCLIVIYRYVYTAAACTSTVDYTLVLVWDLLFVGFALLALYQNQFLGGL